MVYSTLNKYSSSALPAILALFISLLSAQADAQFYRGSSQEFGKNRVQYDEFIWMNYKFDKYNVYYNTGGQKLAVYTAKSAQKTLDELEKLFDYYVENKIHIIVYNKIEHYRQSNVGLHDNQAQNIGGVTRISGSKVFIYFNGDHTNLEMQIRAGIAEIVINHMMYGDNWKEMVKNSTLLTLPDWYVEGLVSYASRPWDVEIDNRVRDGVVTGKYNKFNRLTGVDAKYAGHALWHYISETYGIAVVPNILYMSRISRNIESGFLFVLGISLKTLLEESLEYYRNQYRLDDEIREMPKAKPAAIKVRKSKVYTQLKVSPDGTKLAYATNELGKTKVYVQDLIKGKKKKVLRNGFKLDRVNDLSYPLIAWHPNGDMVSVINEKKGKIVLTMYRPETKKKLRKNIFKLEKILDFSYSNDGKKLVFSAISKGHTDIYVYKVASNVQEQITNDVYDDLNPRFINNSSDIIFSSNRQNDTLRTDKEVHMVGKSKDLFIAHYSNRSNVLRRVTTTEKVNELNPIPFSDTHFTFLSDENGIVNRYLAHFDSVISRVDTSVHYRYITRVKPITNYSRNILEHDINIKAGKYTEILYSGSKYQLYMDDLSSDPISMDMDMQDTGYREDVKKTEKKKDTAQKGVEEQTDSKPGKEAVYTTVKVPEEKIEDVNPTFVDILNYKFEKEKRKAEGKQKLKENQEKARVDSLKKDSRFITLTKEGQDQAKPAFVLPKALNYHLSFAATEIVSQFDFDFANQLYQRFNGGPYFNPGLGLVVKIGMRDLFEDYKIEGGIRYSFSNNNTEYFLSLDNREGRLDKRYVLQRQSMTSVSMQSLIKVHTHQAKYILKWPFNEVAAIRGTFNLRNDRKAPLSTDQGSLILPIEYINWAGAKFEFIFDNTIDKGLNLYNGTRWKIFGEYYKEITEAQTDIEIVGLDFRHYQKIHRDLIWANRLAASTSFGNRKLVYYMGSVDNWIRLNAAPPFWHDTRIATDQSYYFQTIGTPLRGFLQNIRNGNSMALINSEIRWPIFRYLMNKPIKSDFKKNFQIIAFGDVGTAWTGPSPWSDDNAFNTKIIIKGPLTITFQNQKEPVIGGYGLALRSRIWGYFVRLDYAWGVEDGVIQEPKLYFSLGLDF